MHTCGKETRVTRVLLCPWAKDYIHCTLVSILCSVLCVAFSLFFVFFVFLAFALCKGELCPTLCRTVVLGWVSLCVSPFFAASYSLCRLCTFLFHRSVVLSPLISLLCSLCFASIPLTFTFILRNVRYVFYSASSLMCLCVYICVVYHGTDATTASFHSVV